MQEKDEELKQSRVSQTTLQRRLDDVTGELNAQQKNHAVLVAQLQLDAEAVQCAHATRVADLCEQVEQLQAQVDERSI